MNWRFWERNKEVPSKPVDAAVTPLPEYLNADIPEAPTPSMFQAEPVDVAGPETGPESRKDDRMDPEAKKRWVAALRSGKYKQGIGRLRVRQEHHKSGYCCLGVLCEIAVQDGVIRPPERVRDGGPTDGYKYEYDGDAYALGPKVQDWAMLDANPIVKDEKGRTTTLADLNDEGMPFEKIADLIEDQL